MVAPERPRLECLGGPQDGERVPDRGVFWLVLGRMGADGQVIPGSAGTYVQRAGTYRWEPDPT